ncbi:MAG TPA: retron system putative HNH endonuclease [Kofleriaceae bacterium]|nr:retron system putative HNH endonuclease [Kofleriaceae bacterium]
MSAALREMTDERCAYCDGHPIDAMGEQQIDHFQPKTDPRFVHLVCDWRNLFIACMQCNKAKGARWQPSLLRPDDGEFTFERYFQYRFDTGELQPNEVASQEDQERARTTIEILGLNRAGACKVRKWTIQRLRHPPPDDDAGDLPYRYLTPYAYRDAQPVAGGP